jgi:hypothetical protein
MPASMHLFHNIMKYLPLSLFFGVSGLLFSSFVPTFLTRVQPNPITPDLAGISCPEDKDKPCVDEEIRLISINPERLT